MIDIYSLATVAGWGLIVATVVYFAAGLDWQAALADVPKSPTVAAPAIDRAKPVDLMIIAHRACVAAGLQDSAGRVAAGISAALAAAKEVSLEPQ